MIVFNLNCSDCAASFEGSFENTKDYNKQIRKGLVNCPYCNLEYFRTTLQKKISNQSN